jgi:amidase/6-aminohexanoate-cyclic-dimer hydrolase
MGTLKDYASYDALGLAELVRKKEVTASELLEEAIERVEAINPKINAVVKTMYDEARKSIQDGLPAGPLGGVPFLLKDLGAYYKGVPVTSGSRFFADYVPDHDSELVTRFKKAGLVIFGRTNTPEFGLTLTTEPRLFGPTRNPWNLERTTGGSSGGAAAAVASGIVPVAHASDGGGSIRIPASCCGLFGLKPTRGRVSKGPDLGEGWNGMSIDHVVSRTVRDSAAFLDAVAGPALGDPYRAPHTAGPFLDEVSRKPGKLKIAYTTTPPSGSPVDAECKDAVHAAVTLCESLGHDVKEDAPAVDISVFGPAFIAVINVNTRATLEARAREIGRDVTQDDVEHITWLTAEAGKSMAASEYVQSVQTIHRI